MAFYFLHYLESLVCKSALYNSHRNGLCNYFGISRLVSKKSGNIFKEIFFLSFLSILTGILLLTPFLSYKWGNRQTGFLLEEKITLPAGTLLVTAGLPTAAFAAEIAERNENIKLLGFTDEYPNAHWKNGTLPNTEK